VREARGHRESIDARCVFPVMGATSVMGLFSHVRNARSHHRRRPLWKMLHDWPRIHVWMRLLLSRIFPSFNLHGGEQQRR
jgi:hypothetical protein